MYTDFQDHGTPLSDVFDAMSKRETPGKLVHEGQVLELWNHIIHALWSPCVLLTRL